MHRVREIMKGNSGVFVITGYENNEKEIPVNITGHTEEKHGTMISEADKIIRFATWLYTE